MSSRIILNGHKIHTLAQFYDVINKKLQLPDYFGRNLDALNDCLKDYNDLTIAIWHGDTFLSKEKSSLRDTVLEILRSHAVVTGKKL